MDIRMIFEIVIFVFCGACIAYLKTNATIKEKIVEFIGKGEIWVSDYDNNVWEPGVFGWHKKEG